MNESSTFLGEDGMAELFHQSVNEGGEILKLVQDKILKFCGNNPPMDDMAMVCIQL